jgi:phospholipase/carboxylesterase
MMTDATQFSLVATLRPDEVEGMGCEILPPRRPEEGRPPLLVLLHGVGSNEHDLLGLAPYVDPRFMIASVRAPFPSGSGGFAWFRVTFTAGGPMIDEEQEAKSRELLPRFIDSLVLDHGADPHRVFLLGFSQGAIMALSLALAQPRRYAGAAAFSGRILPQVGSAIPDPAALAGTPIFLAHGVLDDVIPVTRARSARAFLSGLPVRLDYREYSTGHEIGGPALRDAAVWLTARLDETTAVATQA